MRVLEATLQEPHAEASNPSDVRGSPHPGTPGAWSDRREAMPMSTRVRYADGMPSLLSVERSCGRLTLALLSSVVLALAAPASPVAAQFARTPSDPCASGAPRDRITACSQVLFRVPLDPTLKVIALVNRALAHDALGEEQLAVEDFRAALEVNPSSVIALRGRAGSLYRRGQASAALGDVNRALALVPDDVGSLRLRGDILAETGDRARAIEDYSKVLDRVPSDLLAREGRGLALASAGDHVRAVQDFTRVIERTPGARVARAARAFSLFQLKRYPQAITDWNQLLATDPSELSFVYCRGAARMLSGDVDGGQADIQTVMQQRPDVAAAQAAACGAVQPAR